MVDVKKPATFDPAVLDLLEQFGEDMLEQRPKETTPSALKFAATGTGSYNSKDHADEHSLFFQSSFGGTPKVPYTSGQYGNLGPNTGVDDRPYDPARYPKKSVAFTDGTTVTARYTPGEFGDVEQMFVDTITKTGDGKSRN